MSCCPTSEPGRVSPYAPKGATITLNGHDVYETVCVIPRSYIPFIHGINHPFRGLLPSCPGDSPIQPA